MRSCEVHANITWESFQAVAAGRRSGLMVSALVPGARGLGLSPGRGYCVGKTPNSHSASLHPGV